MTSPYSSIRRAAWFPVVVLAVLSWTVASASASGHLLDDTGVSGDDFGRSAAFLEDIDGDGFDELIVGVPGVGGGSGRVDFWWGGDWTYVAPDDSHVGTGGENLGWCVAAIGDVDGGGKADFAAGAPLHGTDRGRVYVFYGEDITRGGGLGVPTIITGEADNDGFGFSISAAGNFNGSGPDDFIVGAPDPSALDSGSSRTGAAYVIYGAGGGPSTSLASALKLTGPALDSRFGWSVAGVGDFLAGSAPSVAVGAPLFDGFGLDAGAVYVYEGGITPNGTVDHTIRSDAANVADGWYGFAVASAGDWDSDSWADLVVGAPYDRTGSDLAGRVEIIFGGSSPSDRGDRSVVGASADDEFGYHVAGVGDVDGGNDDVLIGAPRANIGATDAGAVYVYSGGSASQPTGPGALVRYANDDAPVSAALALDLYGTAVAGAGDFDGDAQVDLLVGAPAGNNDVGGPDAGFVHLIHSTAGPVAGELQRWQARWVADDGVAAVALEFSLALPASRVAEMTLTRTALTPGGLPGAASTLWSGPAVAPGPVPADGGYRYVDHGPFSLPADGSLSYDLTVTADDGTVMALSQLAGPAGAAPVFGLAIERPRPNPSSVAATNFRFRARAGDPVVVTVHDVRGRRVSEIFNGAGTGGWETARWDGRDTGGAPVAAGVYHLRVRSPEGERTVRIALVR